MILNVVMIVCIAAILVCGLQITRSLIEYKKAKDKNDGLSDIMSGLLESTTIATTIQTSTTAPVSTETSVGETEDTSVTETTKPEPIPREQYREIYTQLTTMKAQYPELYGWIHIEFDEKHVINLPVMQSEDNNMYYIDHAYDGTESMAGAIFADYRNTARRLDFNQNLILYGHHMNNGTNIRSARSLTAHLSLSIHWMACIPSTPSLFITLRRGMISTALALPTEV